MAEFDSKTVTVEECRQSLETWLDLAAHNPIYNHYDQLCHRAYELLPNDEYDRIYNRWARGYTLCGDGYYRRF